MQNTMVGGGGVVAGNGNDKPRHKSHPGHDRELQPSPATMKPDQQPPSTSHRCLADNGDITSQMSEQELQNVNFYCSRHTALIIMCNHFISISIILY